MFDTVIKIFKYGLVTAGSYTVLLLGTYVSVDWLGFPATPSYIVVLTMVYVGVYFASANLVFNSNAHKTQWKKYVVAVMVFWTLNATLYAVLVDIFNIQYLLSVIINILIFGPLRYFTYSKWVFKKQS